MPRRRPETAHIMRIAGSIKSEAFSDMELIAASAVIVEPQSTAEAFIAETPRAARLTPAPTATRSTAL